MADEAPATKPNPTEEAAAPGTSTSSPRPASPTTDALTGEPVPPVPAPINIPPAPVDNSPVDGTVIGVGGLSKTIPMVRLADGTMVPAPNMGDPKVTPEVLANNPSDLRNAPKPPEKVTADVADAQAWIKEGEPADWPKPDPQVPSKTEGSPAPPEIIEAPGDMRALWDCVTPQGPRTGCRPFRSDDHLIGLRIVCPTCSSTTVLRLDG